MRIAFHQPNYLPSLGFFYKMAEVDLFVITTNLQFMRHEWHTRAKLRAAQDRDLLITVPVLGSNRQLIKDARINDGERWRRKHVGTLQSLYGRSKNQSFLKRLIAIYDQPHVRLAELNIAFINLIKEELEITTPLIVDEEVDGARHEFLIGLCRKYAADTYVSGLGGKAYIDDEYVRTVADCGIAIDYVGRDVTGDFPYSSIHYLLEAGTSRARSIVAGAALCPHSSQSAEAALT